MPLEDFTISLYDNDTHEKALMVTIAWIKDSHRSFKISFSTMGFNWKFGVVYRYQQKVPFHGVNGLSLTWEKVLVCIRALCLKKL